jgi:hypothetical protein
MGKKYTVLVRKRMRKEPLRNHRRREGKIKIDSGKRVLACGQFI